MTAQSEYVEIQSVDQLALAFFEWHKRQLETLKHFQEIPEGSEVEIDGEKLVLTGVVMKGFKVGLEMGRQLFAKLPIQVTEEDEPSN